MLFFFFTLGGLVLLLVPGLIVWLYAMYDAYTVAGKMNTGEIEFRETRTLQVVLFIVFAIILVSIALMVIIAIVMAALASRLRPLGITDFNQVLGIAGL